jgi:hypothetical protein
VEHLKRALHHKQIAWKDFPEKNTNLLLIFVYYGREEFHNAGPGTPLAKKLRVHKTRPLRFDSNLLNFNGLVVQDDVLEAEHDVDCLLVGKGDETEPESRTSSDDLNSDTI